MNTNCKLEIVSCKTFLVYCIVQKFDGKVWQIWWMVVNSSYQNNYYYCLALVNTWPSHLSSFVFASFVKVFPVKLLHYMVTSLYYTIWFNVAAAVTSCNKYTVYVVHLMVILIWQFSEFVFTCQIKCMHCLHSSISICDLDSPCRQTKYWPIYITYQFAKLNVRQMYDIYGVSYCSTVHCMGYSLDYSSLLFCSWFPTSTIWS